MQRVFGVLLSVGLSLAGVGGWLFWLQGLGQVVAPTNGTVIINEWSQGNGGSREWVELLVVTGPADLRGWDLGDSTPGDLQFSNDAAWSALPAGTLVVIYNGSDPDTVLPPDDEDGSDCRLVVGHNNGRFFTGTWPAIANTTASDNPHLRDASGATVHDFTQAPGLHPAAQQGVAFIGETAVSLPDAAQWQIIPATDTTPGTGNGGSNTAWVDGLCGGVSGVDVTVSKSGPASAPPGATVVYQLRVQNVGDEVATAVRLTDTLPLELTYIADSSGLSAQHPNAQTLVWELGDLAAGSTVSFVLTTTLATTAIGTVSNQLAAATTAAEVTLANNSVVAQTAVSLPTTVLIDAVYVDGYEPNDLDEAVALWHGGETAVDVAGWKVGDGGSGTAVLPVGAQLQPGQTVWLARDGSAFTRQFGFPPDFEHSDSSPNIPNLGGSWPGFANGGDEVVLLDVTGAVVDWLAYGTGSGDPANWQGAALQPYTVPNVFTSEGQILYRKRDQATGLPLPDSNTAVDWAQEGSDPINGRKVRYPGWDFDAFFHTVAVTETAVLTIAQAPDNAFATLAQHIQSANHTIQMAALTFDNWPLAQQLMAASQRGVAVTVLLEGEPVGGMDDQEKYVCQQLEAAGGACWFMIRDDAIDIQDRYRFYHAKYMIIDGKIGVVSSENFSPRSFPDDDKSDGTLGHRGVVLLTDAPTVVAHLQTLFARDLDPANHHDLFRWQASHPKYGAPPAYVVPITMTGGVDYPVRYPTPLTLHGTFAFELVQSPDNSLRSLDGLLGLVGRAGAGDVVLVQQLSERPFWGRSSSNPTDDPNLRLEAYLAAARRGATVRLLFDSYFDDPTAPVSNAATCAYALATARQEQLDVDCRVGNPTGLGIHNKMVLVQLNGRGYVHVGSINGTEQASKGNRELALQVQSNEAYTLLAEMFNRDWPSRAYLPVVRHGYRGRAQHVLISEVLYNPSGVDDAEFVELVNPTGFPIDISGYSLGDAVNRDDFEDVRRFPVGTILEPQATLVVATSATAFFAEYGVWPDFEILETETAVANLIDDQSWGDTATFLQLGNAGDEVILRNPADQIVDLLTYGTSTFPGAVPCPVVTASNHSLERFPYWRDADNCATDFRDWPFPNPNALP